MFHFLVLTHLIARRTPCDGSRKRCSLSIENEPVSSGRFTPFRTRTQACISLVEVGRVSLRLPKNTRPRQFAYQAHSYFVSGALVELVKPSAIPGLTVRKYLFSSHNHTSSWRNVDCRHITSWQEFMKQFSFKVRPRRGSGKKAQTSETVFLKIPFDEGPSDGMVCPQYFCPLMPPLPMAF